MTPPWMYRWVLYASVALLVWQITIPSVPGILTGIVQVVLSRMLQISWGREAHALVAAHAKLKLPPFELGHLGESTYRISRSASGETVGVEVWQPMTGPAGGYAYTVAAHPTEKPDLG